MRDEAGTVARAERRGEAQLSPSEKPMWEIVACPRVTRSEPGESRSRREGRRESGAKNPNVSKTDGGRLFSRALRAGDKGAGML